MGEGGIKNYQKKSDVFYGQPLRPYCPNVYTVPWPIDTYLYNSANLVLFPHIQFDYQLAKTFKMKLAIILSVCISLVYCGKYALYNVLLSIARNFLETRESIKISTHPFYHVNLDWFSWEWSKKKFFFWKKKSKMAVFQKWPFFKIANSQNFFVKISQIRPWVSRIAWCEGHWSGSTYMVVRLSDISSKTAKKHKKSIFSLF